MSAQKRANRKQTAEVPLEEAFVQPGGVPEDLPSPEDEGLSRTATADSESVGELLDEGNAFEAGIISGVERAGDSEGKEVHTHQVPEDDVPGEYLENDW